MNSTLDLIIKLISKTKDGFLSWQKLSHSAFTLKPPYQSPLDEANVIHSPSVSEFTDSENCYLCNYQEGYFILLFSDNFAVPPTVELRIQTKNSDYSQIIATTDTEHNDDDTIKITSQLKRLYNIVANAVNVPSVEQLINNFMNE